MTIPHSVRIAALVVLSTAFYGYVGQMVPQNEVHPPAEVVIRADLTTPEMVDVGREIAEGKGLCRTCHTIGQSGALRFPDLDGVAGRAPNRIPGLTDVEYFAQSLYEPDSYVVEGFNPGMPPINRPPIGLTDQEILCVIAYLQSLGGTPTVTLQTAHRYYTPAAAPGAAPAAGASPAQNATPGAPLPQNATPGAPVPQNATPGKPPISASLSNGVLQTSELQDRMAVGNDGNTEMSPTVLGTVGLTPLVSHEASRSAGVTR
jgi:hypothetical protein